MDSQSSPESSRRRANELYWETGLGVNQIADELAISKGALYELLDPTPTGDACDECGFALEFVNRTARDRAEAQCSHCDVDGTPERLDSTDPSEVDPEAVAALSGAESNRSSLFGAALVGVAVGLAIAAFMNRR